MSTTEAMHSLDGFLIPKGYDFEKIWLEDMTDYDIHLDRFLTRTLPGAGEKGYVFSISSDEAYQVKELKAVILHQHLMSFLFENTGREEERYPVCETYDGITGLGEPGGECRQCRYNQFGSGSNGGKRCRNKRRLYLLEEAELLPVILDIPTGSLKNLRNYVKELLSFGWRPSAVVTKIRLEKAGEGENTYALFRFEIDRMLTDQERRDMETLAGQVRAVATHLAERFAEQETCVVTSETEGLYEDPF